MQVLFLDIDGVLNSVQSAIMHHRFRKEKRVPSHFRAYSEEEFCPIAISNLLTIVESLKNLKIVISSTWRLGSDIKTMKGWFDEMAPLIGERIIDSTPVFRDAQRGEEIAHWVRDNWRLVKKYAVLDDDSDMDAVKDHFFQTDNQIGLDYLTARQVIKHLALAGELDEY